MGGSRVTSESRIQSRRPVWGGGDSENGIEVFCNQNDGEGWMLPETLCLVDYGLGHDARSLLGEAGYRRLLADIERGDAFRVSRARAVSR